VETSSNARVHPEIPSEEWATRDLVKRIRKLRWTGRQEEAKRLQAALSGRLLVESVLVLPIDTD
jgi:hypothetical protein